MAPNRGSPLLLGPAQAGPILLEVVDVDHRGRVRLPARLVAAMKWLAERVDGVDSLVVLEEPGRIALRPWEDFQDLILARRRALISEAQEGDADAQEALVILEDRFGRIVIPSEHRLTLRTEWLFHLGLNEGERSRIYVAAVLDRILIMSAGYRNESIRAGLTALSDLP